MAVCEPVQTVTVVGLPFLVFLMPIPKASEVAHSSASNEPLFSPRYRRCFCYLFSFSSNQTIVDPAFLISNLDTSTYKTTPFQSF